ncbi:MAG: DUF177 domain-containing protein [Bdellovibrionales bacterium]|nr:DUF177 domain-containing protein [Bdellovibrionales bacterium]
MHLELSNSDVFLTGKAQTSIDALCYRCGGTCQYPVNLNIFLTCAQKEPRRSRIKAKPPGRKGQQRAFADQSTDQVMEESEEGLVFYDNQELDLDEIIKEQLLLSLPMRYLCKEDCKGVCMACGADLNSGVHTCKNLSN